MVLAFKSREKDALKVYFQMKITNLSQSSLESLSLFVLIFILLDKVCPKKRCNSDEIPRVHGHSDKNHEQAVLLSHTEVLRHPMQYHVF